MEEYRYEPGPDQQASMNAASHPVTGNRFKKEKVVKQAGDVSMTKIYMWLGIGLLITGAIALAVPYVFAAMTNNFTQDSELFSTVYVVMLVVSLVLMLPSSIMMGFNVGSRKSGLMKAGYFVYVVGMGFMVSSLFLSIYAYTYDPTEANAVLNPAFLSTISVSFLATAGCFILMGIIGSFTKHMNAAIPVVITGFVGVMIMSLVNLFLGVEAIYWIIDFVCFGLILLVTAIDTHNIRKIADSSQGMNGNNLAIYCAYCLYVDFINILIRVIYYVLILTSKKKN